MKILAVGCSFMCRHDHVIPQCEVVAKRLDADIDNRSKAGNGNTHIVYNTIDAMLENTYDLVLIGWSNPLRWDYITAPNKWFSFKVSNNLSTVKRGIDVEGSMYRHWSSKVILLTNYFNSKGIPFIMWNSLDCWHYENTKLNKELTNIREFVDITNSQFTDLRSKEQWFSPDDHHPNQQSQDEWADKILEKV